MFDGVDILFELLAEYLNEKVAGHDDLEAWFDNGNYYL